MGVNPSQAKTVVIRATYQCDKWLLMRNKTLLISEKWVRYGTPNCV